MLHPKRKKSRRKSKIKKLPVLLFALFLSFSASPEEISQKVDVLIEEGEEYKARALLRAWLMQNTEDGAFSTLLDRYFDLEPDLPTLRGVLSDLLAKAQSGDNVNNLWAKKAILEEMTGDIDRAQQAYHMAAIFAEDHNKAAYLLESTRLLFEEGFLERAGEELIAIFLLTRDPDIIAKASIIKAYIAIRVGKVEEARQMLAEILASTASVAVKPQVLLALVSVNLDNEQESQKYLKQMEAEYPKSPEYALGLSLTGEEIPAAFLMTPWLYLESYLFEEQEPHRAFQTLKVPFAIQTGSFLVKENAEYMTSDLEAVGFSAQVEETEREGRVYYRVVIGGMQTVEEAQEKLRELKAAAFDGFLIIGQK